MTPEYLIGGVMPYFTAVLLILGIIYRGTKWSKTPQLLPWEIFPYPETTGAQIKYLLKEVITQHALKEHNRRMWIPALIMHWGLYLAAFWIILVLIGVQNAYYVGVVGAGGVVVGTVAYLLIRASTELRRITSFVEYFNLIFLLVISLLAIWTDFFLVVNREYLLSILTLSPKTAIFSGGSLVTLFFVQLFLIYLPYNRMAHFFAKYFTYHLVKWGHPGH